MMSYIALLADFVGNKVSIDQFECEFLLQFKSETRVLPATVFDLLNQIFYAVDAYCSDPKLRNTDDLSETELRAICSSLLTQLKQVELV